MKQAEGVIRERERQRERERESHVKFAMYKQIVLSSSFTSARQACRLLRSSRREWCSQPMARSLSPLVWRGTGIAELCVTSRTECCSQPMARALSPLVWQRTSGLRFHHYWHCSQWALVSGLSVFVAWPLDYCRSLSCSTAKGRWDYGMYCDTQLSSISC